MNVYCEEKRPFFGRAPRVFYQIFTTYKLFLEVREIVRVDRHIKPLHRKPFIDKSFLFSNCHSEDCKSIQYQIILLKLSKRASVKRFLFIFIISVKRNLLSFPAKQSQVSHLPYLCCLREAVYLTTEVTTKNPSDQDEQSYTGYPAANKCSQDEQSRRHGTKSTADSVSLYARAPVCRKNKQ